MSTPFHLVSCVSQKLTQPAPARDLYCSRWFRLVRKIIEHRGESWAILSAKHGLVMPETVIEPYDETLGKRSRIEREQWAEGICVAIPPADRFVIWAGENYFEFLAPMLGAELPLKGMGIGQQLSYLTKLADEAPPLLDAARDALELLNGLESEVPDDERASEFQWDNVKAKLRKAIAAAEKTGSGNERQE